MPRYNLTLNEDILNQRQPPAILPGEVDARLLALTLRAHQYGVNVIPASQVRDKSAATGNAIYLPLQFEALTYTDATGTEVKLDGLYMPCVICEFTLTKHIVTTALSGTKHKGDINEHVGIGNWTIDIKGLFVGNNAYPENDVKTLYRYMLSTEPIPVTHAIFRLLEIEYIIITRPSLPNKQGFEHIQPFSLSAVSDTPITLNLQ